MSATDPGRAILDACVLIPAALRDTLLRAAAAGLSQPCWSEDILAEVQRNLSWLRISVLSADSAYDTHRFVPMPSRTATGTVGIVSSFGPSCYVGYEIQTVRTQSCLA